MVKSSDRTQFIKRIVQFSLEHQLRIHLIYYPPYHSKYNSIERCWAVLENYWNCAILDTVSAAINWASNMMSDPAEVSSAKERASVEVER